MNYHPDIDFLLKYSSGQLEPALTVAISLHIQNCKICREQIAQLEEVGGATLESIEQDEINDDLFRHLLEEVNNLPIEQSVTPFEEFAIAELDRPLVQQLSERDYSNLDWQKVTSKISKATIAMNDSHFEVELLKFSPKAKIPKHTHIGKEITVVLEGEFSDKDGNYQAGEFIVKDSSEEHQPLAGDEGCVCLAITDAPLKFTGTFGSLINWWVR
ncbi:MAG: ChrR family anti-sigma-E factor [Kangiellaceae bacterium]